jgi:hypothetical protein
LEKALNENNWTNKLIVIGRGEKTWGAINDTCWNGGEIGYRWKCALRKRKGTISSPEEVVTWTREGKTNIIIAASGERITRSWIFRERKTL